MATTHPHHWYDLSFHRPWEDWVSAIVGLVVIFAPMAIAVTDNVWATNSAAFVGVLIVVLAALENINWWRWEEVLEAICGLWLIASPYIFGYGGAEATLHMAAGALVFALGVIEYWQDRNRTE